MLNSNQLPTAHGLDYLNVQGLDNPGYESQSVHSDNYRVMESVISPPRRSSVIYIGTQESGEQSGGLTHQSSLQGRITAMTECGLEHSFYR